MSQSASKHYLEEELEALMRSDPSMFRFLREGSLDGIWYWDITDPQHEWMSPEFWRLFGIDPATKEHKASEWQDLIFPEDRDLALDNFAKHCADPKHPYDQVVRYRHVDGSTVWVRCRGIAIRDDNGVPVRLLGAHNDITLRVVAEQRYRSQAAAVAEANAKALQALETNRELRAMTYAISHDMKSPSNTLRRLLSEAVHSLDEGQIDDARHFIELGRESVERMYALTESLVTYNRALERDENHQDVDLSDVVRQIVAELSEEIRACNASIEQEPLPTIVGDPIHFQTIFRNLLSNAIKYRKKGVAPIVRISAMYDQSENELVVTVADNGIGIAPKFHGRVFEMFKRLHIDSDIPGTGLGLSLCQRLVGLYGGTIELQSEEDRGAIFRMRLPH